MATRCAPKAGTTASAQHNNTIHLLVTTRPPQIREETEIGWTQLRNLGCAGSVEKFSTLRFTRPIYEDCRKRFQLCHGGKDRCSKCLVPLFSKKCPERVESSLRFPHG